MRRYTMSGKLRKLTGKELAKVFQETTGFTAPENNKTYTCDTPTPIRPVAEYEPMGGALVAYIGTKSPDADHKQLPPSGKRTFGVPNELIVRMQQADTDTPVHVFVLCDDASEKEHIIISLQKTSEEKGIKFDPNLIHLIPWDTDTYWTRDFSPWWVRYIDAKGNDTDQFAISKHIYTSLGGGSVGMIEGAEEVSPREGSGIFRCNDDYGAVKISDYLNAPIRRWNNAVWGSKKQPDPIKTHRWFFSGLLNVGGNYMATSTGIIASSYLVATQNELPTDADPETPDQEAMDNRMKYIMEQTNRFLGANTYHVLTDPTGTYIGHIDCWGKFLADDKILIAQSEDEAINAGLDEISEYFQKQGFEVFRVLCQNLYVPAQEDGPATTAAYTNSLILNKCVYVPMSGEKDHDDAAIEVYQKALGSEYTIYGIAGKPETPWLGTDALHCRTNAIPREVVNNWLKSQKLDK